jgi:hypothetical protein
MLIALLAVLGVDVWVIAVVLAGVLTRRRWVSRQPGAFKGAIRVIDGGVPGLSTKWKRGYGRWVRDILVWTKAPFLFRTELVVADSLAGNTRTANRGELKRLGKHPVIFALTADGGARIEVASAEGGRERAARPFAAPAPAHAANQTGTQTGAAPQKR